MAETPAKAVESLLLITYKAVSVFEYLEKMLQKNDFWNKDVPVPAKKKNVSDTDAAKRWGDRVTCWTEETKPQAVSGGKRFRLYGDCEFCQKKILLDRNRYKNLKHFRCRRCAKALGVVLGQPIFNASLWAMRDLIASVLSTPVKRINFHDYVRNDWFLRCRTQDCEGVWQFSSAVAAVRCGQKISGLCKSCSYIARTKRPFESLYNAFVKSAQKRRSGIIVALTYEQFHQLCLEKECFYCRGLLERDTSIRGSAKNGRVQLDRKDHCLGYAIENVVPCCSFCNYTRGALVTHDEMIVIGLLRQRKVIMAARHLGGVNLNENDRHVSDVRAYLYKLRKKSKV